MGDLRDTARGVIDRSTSQILADLVRLWDDLEDEQRRLAEKITGTRLVARRMLLAGWQRSVEESIKRIESTLRGGIPSTVHAAWVTGADMTADALGVAAVHDLIDAQTLASYADDLWSDVLERTSYMRAEVKAIVRDLTRAQALRVVGLGSTSRAESARVAQLLEGRGIAAITYADGTRRTLPDYADMLLRTKTALIMQDAGIGQARRLGVRWMEILDGPGCGLVGHDDPQKADGMIVSVEEASRYRISHPRCVRVTTPRPDVVDAAPVLPSPGFEPGPVVTPAAGAVASPAARRPRRPAAPRRPARPVRGG